jgi:surface carbohydrate biosynthesis protein (TIGR04326 family)
LPKQRAGFYLQEFQAWEASLLDAWNSYSKNNNIIAVPHSTIRFWDLRYFNDPRCFEGPVNTSMPVPGHIALNGLLQEKNYDHALLSQIKTSHVEALRYMHLRKSQNSPEKQKHADDTNFVILILGDYKLENTITQITMITECLTKLPSSTKFFLKPHPVVTLPKSLLMNVPVTVTTEPIEDILPMCDLAITSNVTTAALDAFLKKIPVICVFHPSKLNLSPLKELDSSLFASSSAELLDKILLVMENAPISFCKPEEVFNLDSSLGMWLNLIKRQIK